MGKKEKKTQTAVLNIQYSMRRSQWIEDDDSNRTPHYTQGGETRLSDIAGDAFYSVGGAGILEIDDLSLDEPDMKTVLFRDEVDDVQDP